MAQSYRPLGLENIAIESRHAPVRGEYGRYSARLGSGNVHKQPGGSLSAVACPAGTSPTFADDDPRTAEIVSKVLLLARDREI